MQASRELVGHGANIYLPGRLLYSSSIKHTSCMKVGFWMSSRRARVEASAPASPGCSLHSARLELIQKLTFIQTVKVIIVFNRQTSG